MAVSQLSLGTLRTNVRTKLNEPAATSSTQTTFWLDSEINQWLNDAKNVVFQRFRLLKQATGTVTSNATVPANTTGVNYLDVPSDWVETETLTMDLASVPGNPTPVVFLDYRDFVARSPDMTATGKPVVAVQIAESSNDQPRWLLWPQPDQTYKYLLEYAYIQDDMAADSDTPGFDARWNHALVDYACSQAWLKGRRAPAMAEYFKGLWDEALDKMFEQMVMRAQSDWVTRYVEPQLAPPTNPTNPLEWS